jgi:predicted NAD/FAD-binding protein
LPSSSKAPLRIAVIGSGISGLSAAWLLSKAHDVTLYEAEGRLGGHSHTVDVETSGGTTPVDTGFIVYNVPSYPNLTAFFDHLGVETLESEMSFAVSLDGGRFEYGSTGLGSLFAQKRNLLRPRFWAMIADVLKFQKHGVADAERWTDETSLREYMAMRGFGRAFQEDHLLPQAAAIWSSPLKDIGDYPARALLRFFDNHGLLNLAGGNRWRTVKGGSREYIKAMMAQFEGRILLSSPVSRVTRKSDGVVVETAGGATERYDRVVIAAHADQALRMLSAPTQRERDVLGAFSYSRNRTVLHGDASFMPNRRAAWSSWNHQGRRGLDDKATITYWMNLLQGFATRIDPLFVTLNPSRDVVDGRIHVDQMYEHPLFNTAAMAAQRLLPTLQGEGGIWYAGAYFGSGFHEDGLQAGLVAAEAIGGVSRPWQVENANGRMPVAPPEALEVDRTAA